MVPMLRARQIPVVGAFISLLETRPFLVRRTYGPADTGWKPNFGSISKEEFIHRINGMWTIPLVKDEKQFKNVPIKDFAEADFAESAAALLAALDAGIYAEDARQAALLPKGSLAETRGITTLMVDGVPCRVVLPNTTSESCP